ncbi:hypothetical protein ExPUPEC79_02137 [Escherichia coli]|nr:hypothetical protein ExPUPEC79_02137 [Escherichia coli]
MQANRTGRIGQIAINRHVGKISQAVSFKVGIKLTCQRHAIGGIHQRTVAAKQRGIQRLVRILLRQSQHSTIGYVDIAARGGID